MNVCVACLFFIYLEFYYLQVAFNDIFLYKTST